MKRLLLSALLAFIISVVLVGSGFSRVLYGFSGISHGSDRVSATRQSRPSRAVSSAPSLVVLLVVDQMRGDYVLKYGQQWKSGLRQLVDEGAWFQQAEYAYANTVTCAGHATISTGAFPSTHGITDNSWWDRAAGRSVACADDPSAQTISYGAPVPGGKSPARLIVPTFTDHLRAQLAIAPRIVTMSIKERTAIMLAGHRADSVTWFDVAARSLVTSSAYSRGRVSFVERFAAAHPVETDLKASWTPAHGPNAYDYSDAAEGEQPPAFWTSVFPHDLKRDGMKPGQAYEAWETSPFSDAYLERLAEAAIDEMKMGKGPGTDFLGISFSALDLVGHDFGPQSHEVQDLLVRLDQALGSLFAFLDRRVGRSRYVVALTADHGVSPIPEQMVAVGIPAGRLPSRVLTEHVEAVLHPALGSAKAVARTAGGQVYFTPEAREAIAGDRRLADALVADIVRIPGVARAVFTPGAGVEARELASDGPSHESDLLARVVQRSYYPDRGGDLVVLLQPYWLFGTGAASHGTPYRYDTWVPLFFFGNGIRPGRYAEAVTPADVAPTLAWLCGVTLPHRDGRPLLEAILK